MGVASPASTLTALGTAADGQEGIAASSLQVAETLGIAMGTGAAGTLVAMSVIWSTAWPRALQWGFILSAAAIALALPLGVADGAEPAVARELAPHTDGELTRLLVVIGCCRSRVALSPVAGCRRRAALEGPTAARRVAAASATRLPSGSRK